MVSSVSGISMAEYQAYLQQESTRTIGATNSIRYENDSTNFSTSKERCTDGKDDGKIGLLSAVGNAVKGVGKTIVNGVKGMFTNSEGKFSLGKTLLSLGTAAVCIAFPAVGVAACAIGGAMGAVQVGKGVYNAATAKTDAEAKEAWQNIGGGAFTVAASVTGAKAGVKAVKSTSTATNGLASLDDTATLGQKAVALSKDMVSSTRNQYNTVKTTATAYSNAAKIKYTEAKANKIDTSGALTSEELHTINNAKYQKMFASDDTLAALEKMDKASNAAKSYAEAAKIKYAEVKANKIDTSSALTSKELYTIKNAEYQKLFASDDTLAALDKINNVTNKAQHVWQTAKGKVTKANAETLLNGIKSVDKNTITQIGSKLTGKAKTIWNELSTGKYSYPEVVNKYGFNNVAEVIQYMSGVVYSAQNI